ncbi:MAG: PHP domain-containing protein [Candidatus Nanoarchaeia archaeon]|nr:PHP domain-containing protein [Candidatus Haiyanarchaeum thermophilum]MCW1302785.1 PHP domain-containing protein [Candidatus Haiyanarchaeum thermophilum]MCW1304117.1 PHP domain-containing protein [Candidatus Haiyanarchaeum thermophilum]MCW1306646.1 PHP domain-containing protein [Candidatus Haiyanarchaeum thermophilum]MCW1307398.1 PHP domain-containing protein [Candidatus Haiyanarchaeum thermophilum]
MDRLVNYLYRGMERLLFLPANSMLEKKISDACAKISQLDGVKADLHIHSLFSDGVNTVDHIAKVAKRKHLDAISITDHDTVSHWKYAERAEKRHGILILPGIELTVIHRNQPFHILAYFPNFDENVAKGLRRNMSFLDAASEIAEKGGVVVLAHPLVLNGINKENLEDLIKTELSGGKRLIHGIEEFNPSAGGFYETLANKYDKAEIAGSDAHEKIGIGLALTLFENPSCKEDMLEEIRKGRVKNVIIAKSSLERNLDKLRMLHPFYIAKTLVEYFDDEPKVIARELTRILEENGKRAGRAQQVFEGSPRSS